MKTITFSSTEKKMNLLMQVAKEMGIKTQEYELTDEEMGLPGPKVSNEQLENWLIKDDGGEHTYGEMKNIIKQKLNQKPRK